MRKLRTETEVALVRDFAERDRQSQESIYPDQEITVAVSRFWDSDRPDWVINRTPKSV
jgi:hypothetical protein